MKGWNLGIRGEKEKRRDEILAHATRLFSEGGYQETEMQMIADSLGKAKGTIYLYFPSKESLFFATVQRAIDLTEAFVKRKVQKEGSSVDFLKSIVRAYVEFFRKHPEFIELFVQERAVFRFRRDGSYLRRKKERDEKWTKIFEQLAREGKLRFSNIPRIVSTINQLFYGVIFTNIFQIDETSFETRLNEGIDMILYGTLLPEGVL